jgi:hypothetical protein
MLTRELEHQNMSLKERLLVARNQLMGGPTKNRRYRMHFETSHLSFETNFKII